MTEDSAEFDDAMDQWANTVGDDQELEAIWAALIEATEAASPAEIEDRIAKHLAKLGARSRRMTEGLILAVIAATAAEGTAWDDWRVILHRHFIRDERIEIAVAAAILLEWRKTGVEPDWHSAPERAMERVIRSFVRDMLLEREAIQKADQPEAASASLVSLASELFDFAISLQAEQLEEIQNSTEIAAILMDMQRRLSEGTEGYAKSVAHNLEKAQALVEVALRQLEISASVVH